MKEGKIRPEPDAVLESVRRLVNGGPRMRAPVDAAPTDPAPVAPATEPGPIDSAPVVSAQVDSAIAESAPLDTAPPETSASEPEVPSGPDPAQSTAAMVDERLLLTPSLRVEEEAPAVESAAPEPAPEPHTPEPHTPEPAAHEPPFEAVVDALVSEGDVLDDGLENRIAELEAAVSSQNGAWEPDGSELVDEETPREFVFGHHRQFDEGAEEPEPAPLAEEEAPLPPLRLEDAPMSPNAPEPEPLGVDLIDETDLPRPLAVDRAETAALAEAGRQEALADAIQEEQAENAFSDPALSLETTLADEAEEQDDDLLPEAAAAAVARVAHVPTTNDAPIGEADPEPEADAAAEGAAEWPVLGTDDIEIDEEMLRDLVAEIVRAELQGEMGVRITRNVRKLVRREIHRALMTRDFG